MAQNILTEELENTLNSIIIPDLEKMYLKDYNTDEDVLNALNEIEEKWKTLILPEEYEKALEMLCSQKYKKEEMIILGDQLMNDVFAGKRYKISVGLIEAIDKNTDIGPTRFNRKLESFFLKRIKRKYPNEYSKTLGYYAGDVDDNKKM